MPIRKPSPLGAERQKALPAPTLALNLMADEFDALNAGSGPQIAYRDLFCPHMDLPRALRNWSEARGVQLRSLRKITHERGGRSQKVLFGLHDGYAVESVLIRRRLYFITGWMCLRLSVLRLRPSRPQAQPFVGRDRRTGRSTRAEGQSDRVHGHR